MGHEYMELKSTSAAIHAYRQAIGWSKFVYIYLQPILDKSHDFKMLLEETTGLGMGSDRPMKFSKCPTLLLTTTSKLISLG